MFTCLKRGPTSASGVVCAVLLVGRLHPRPSVAPIRGAQVKCTRSRSDAVPSGRGATRLLLRSPLLSLPLLLRLLLLHRYYTGIVQDRDGFHASDTVNTTLLLHNTTHYTMTSTCGSFLLSCFLAFVGLAHTTRPTWTPSTLQGSGRKRLAGPGPSFTPLSAGSFLKLE